MFYVKIEQFYSTSPSTLLSYPRSYFFSLALVLSFFLPVEGLSLRRCHKFHPCPPSRALHCYSPIYSDILELNLVPATHFEALPRLLWLAHLIRISRIPISRPQTYIGMVRQPPPPPGIPVPHDVGTVDDGERGRTFSFIIVRDVHGRGRRARARIYFASRLRPRGTWPRIVPRGWARNVTRSIKKLNGNDFRSRPLLMNPFALFFSGRRLKGKI